MAFWDDRALPSGVMGPRDLAPLAREAAWRRLEVSFGGASEVVDGRGVSGGSELSKWFIATSF